MGRDGRPRTGRSDASEQLQPVRAVAAALIGGALGGAVLAAVAGYGAEALLDPQGGAGLAALVPAIVGLLVGATLGAAAAVALAFRGRGPRGRRTTVLTVLAGGVVWGLVWVAVPGLLVAGVVVLPAAALVGRWLQTRP